MVQRASKIFPDFMIKEPFTFVITEIYMCLDTQSIPCCCLMTPLSHQTPVQYSHLQGELVTKETAPPF